MKRGAWLGSFGAFAIACASSTAPRDSRTESATSAVTLPSPHGPALWARVDLNVVPTTGAQLAYDTSTNRMMLRGANRAQYLWDDAASQWTPSDATAGPATGLITTNPLAPGIVLLDASGSSASFSPWTWSAGTWTRGAGTVHGYPPSGAATGNGFALFAASSTGYVYRSGGVVMASGVPSASTTALTTGPDGLVYGRAYMPGDTQTFRANGTSFVMLEEAYDEGPDATRGFPHGSGVYFTDDTAVVQWDGAGFIAVPEVPAPPGPGPLAANTAGKTWLFSTTSGATYTLGVGDEAWTRRPTTLGAVGAHALTTHPTTKKPLALTSSRMLSLADTRYAGVGPTGTWTELASVPPARSDPGVAFDRTRNVVVLEGGIASFNTVSNQTWTFDGTTWTLRANGPPRHRHRLVWDGVAQVVLALGGKASTSTAAQVETAVLAWNGTTWVAHSTLPLGFATVTAGWHEKTGALVVVGTLSDGTAATLTFDRAASTWAPISGTVGPAIEFAGDLVYHPPSEELVLFGAANTWMWRFDGTQWIASSTKRPVGYRAVYDDVSSRLVVAAATGETSLLLRLGGACTANGDCGGNTCLDGVCCETASCGSCQTCNGSTPGRCSIVTNGEDPNSCALADGKSCDASGACKLGGGAVASDAATCATGFIVDGVCCATAACDPCFTCAGDRKTANTFPGRCEPAADGVVESRCGSESVTTCRLDGKCDGRGACRNWPEKTSCSGDSACRGGRLVGAICNGGGTCLEQPGGVDCTPYACRAEGCATRCDGDGDCTEGYACLDARCTPKDSELCVTDHTLRHADGTQEECAPYVCEGSACKTTCASVTDCAYPNLCSSDGRCGETSAAVAAESSSCALARSPGHAGGVVLGVLAAFAAVSRNRRSRRPSERSLPDPCRS